MSLLVYLFGRSFKFFLLKKTTKRVVLWAGIFNIFFLLFQDRKFLPASEEAMAPTCGSPSFCHMFWQLRAVSAKNLSYYTPAIKVAAALTERLLVTYYGFQIFKFLYRVRQVDYD